MDTSDIDAQIAALQEKKRLIVAKAAADARAAEKKAANILVRSTPTKVKPKEQAPSVSRPPQPKFTAFAKPKPKIEPPPRPSSSRLAASLAARRKENAPLPSVPRAAAADDELEIVRDGTERDSDLTLLNDLRLGPGEFGKDSEGEDEWRALEPNSGIRLSKRVLSHSEVQDCLYGRYYLRPSQIYSIARLSRDGQTYDIPVEGDWVTIAVVAERSEVRVSGTRDASDSEEEEDDNKKKSSKKESRRRSRGPRKYINLKLVSLPPRTKASSMSGDAYLQLLLFQSDAIVMKDNKRVYRGGSGGAYEKWCNLAVGSVIAIVNARVLRPLKSGASPHPLTLPLALNPSSDDAISYIGQAMDIGRCTSLQRDGSRCKAWIDTRVGPVCEYHVHAAVKRNRSSRGEFASASTSFDQVMKNDGAYDPKRKMGLLPRNGPRAPPRGAENGGGGATYVVGSGLARTGPVGDAPLSEKMGYSQAVKRKRKAEQEALESAFDKMADRSVGDGTAGGRALKALRAAKGQEEPEADRKVIFSATAIQQIGFDPTGRRSDDPAKRAQSLAALREAMKGPKTVSSFPAKRKSNVVVPKVAPTAQVEEPEEEMIDLD